jgi:hypothetical protein
MALPAPEILRFSGFEVDLTTKELRRRGRPQLEKSTGWHFWRASGPTAALRRTYGNRTLTLMALVPPIIVCFGYLLLRLAHLPTAPINTIAVHYGLTMLFGCICLNWGFSFAALAVSSVAAVSCVAVPTDRFVFGLLPLAVGFAVKPVMDRTRGDVSAWRPFLGPCDVDLDCCRHPDTRYRHDVHSPSSGKQGNLRQAESLIPLVLYRQPL